MRYVLLGLFLFAPLCGAARATELAVTVDDLPIHGALPPGATRMGIARRMLAAFRRQGVREAYGFVNAAKLGSSGSRAILEAWVEAGHPLGNHTYSHPNFSKIPIAKFIADIIRNEPALGSLVRPEVYHFFRYPFLHEGNTRAKRDAVRRFLSRRGYTIAQVSIDFEDWSWNAPYARCVAKRDRASIAWLEKSYLRHALYRLDLARKLSRQLFGREVKQVLLLHIGGLDSIMADRLLGAYRKAGVRFIGLRDALSDPAYAIDSEYVAESSGTFLEQLASARHLTPPQVPEIPEKRLKAICR